MKTKMLFKAMLPVLALALILALSLASPAATAPGDGQVRVWVVFQPGARAPVEAALKAQNAEIHYAFDELNAFAVSLPQAALNGLQNNPNVAYIEEDVQRQMYGQEVPYGIDLVQARDVWDVNRDGAIDPGAPTGSGRIVCIIDSGVFSGHEDLKTVNFIGGYPTGWNTDKCGHGTHVAGTVAAANNAVGVVGVSPGGVPLYIVKVFGDNCSWTYSSTLVDAANRCEAAGAKVISMSLGGTFSSVTERTAFDNLNSKGVLSIAAAGNDGNTRTSYPAGYQAVVSVAAIDSKMNIASFSQQNADVELAAPGVGVRSTVPFTSTNTLTVDGVTYTGSQIEFAASKTASGLLANGGLCGATNSAWAGKVVLCERGTYDFYTKVRNVQLSGGAAAVIYNNVPGGFAGTLGAGNTSTIPAISLSQADGQYLVGNKIGVSGTVISSGLTYNTSGYEAWDGTSMATPHVSGVAALVWSANPNWTNQQVRDAMNSTAKDLGAAGRDNAYGYGLVQAKAALTALGGGGGGGGTTPALVASVATNMSTYAPRETVIITATVTSGGAAVSGATVAMELVKPGGKKVTGSATTNSSGVATFTYKIAPKDPTGDYTVNVTASKSGYTPATATTTFKVQ